MKVKLGPVESIKHLAKAVSSRSDADVVLYSGEISEPSDYELAGRIGRLTKVRKNCLFILTTYGGIADSGYRMMRFLQNHYNSGKISVFVPHLCKSAGTLMVIGADELVMTSVAELGPLDGRY